MSIRNYLSTICMSFFFSSSTCALQLFSPPMFSPHTGQMGFPSESVWRPANKQLAYQWRAISSRRAVIFHVCNTQARNSLRNPSSVTFARREAVINTVRIYIRRRKPSTMLLRSEVSHKLGACTLIALLHLMISCSAEGSVRYSRAVLLMRSTKVSLRPSVLRLEGADPHPNTSRIASKRAHLSSTYVRRRNCSSRATLWHAQSCHHLRIKSLLELRNKS